MSQKIAYSIVHNRRKEKDKNKCYLIQVKMYRAGKNSYISTGVSVLIENWSEKKKIIVKLPNSIELGKNISEIIAKLEKYELQQLSQNILPSFDDMKICLSGTGSVGGFLDVQGVTRQNDSSSLDVQEPPGGTVRVCGSLRIGTAYCWERHCILNALLYSRFAKCGTSSPTKAKSS